MDEYVLRKKSLGSLSGLWVPQSTRDSIVDFVKFWSDRKLSPVALFLGWLGLSKSKFHDWKTCFGQANQHNSPTPRDHWLTELEEQQICQFTREHPLEGYRRLCYMMLDADLVACSPSSVYQVLKQANLLNYPSPKASKKGTGFVQPLLPHEHWHIDICYLKIDDQFYYLFSVLDGCSRFLVLWEIREQMQEKDVEIIMQKARKKYPRASPRIISDNGPQFVAKEFRQFIDITGISHVRTSLYYPQSNGKLEHYHRTLKGDSIRINIPLSVDDGKRIVKDYVDHYNEIRLHSAIGYVTPLAKLEGRDVQIQADRKRKPETAKQRRRELPKPQPEIDKRVSIDFETFKNALKIVDVLKLLGFQEQSRNGSQVRGACPFHRSTHQAINCFSVIIEEQMFHCFKCHRKGNALDLWMLSCKKPIYQATIELCEKLNITLPTNSTQQE